MSKSTPLNVRVTMQHGQSMISGTTEIRLGTMPSLQELVSNLKEAEQILTSKYPTWSLGSIITALLGLPEDWTSTLMECYKEASPELVCQFLALVEIPHASTLTTTAATEPDGEEKLVSDKRDTSTSGQQSIGKPECEATYGVHKCELRKEHKGNHESYGWHGRIDLEW